MEGREEDREFQRLKKKLAAAEARERVALRALRDAVAATYLGDGSSDVPEKFLETETALRLQDARDDLATDARQALATGQEEKP